MCVVGESGLPVAPDAELPRRHPVAGGAPFPASIQISLRDASVTIPFLVAALRLVGPLDARPGCHASVTVK